MLLEIIGTVSKYFLGDQKPDKVNQTGISFHQLKQILESKVL
jgi:hypothetical protein